MTLPNVGNRYVPLRNTEITITMKVDDVPYVIISGIKTNPKSGYCKLYRATLEDVLNDNVSDDNKLTKHSTRETRAFIEKNIIQANFDVFLRSFVLTSDQFYNFFKMSKQDKRVFIENIFDLKIFGEMYRTIHKDKLSNDRVLETLDALVSSQLNDINDMTEKHDHAEETRQADITSREDKITSFGEAIETNKAVLEKHDVTKLTTTLAKLNSTVQGIQHRRGKLESEIKGGKRLIKQLTREYNEKVAYVKTYIETWNELSEHSKPIVNEKLGFETVKIRAKEIAEDVNSKKAKLASMESEIEKCVVPEKVTDSIKQIKEAITKLEAIRRKVAQDEREVRRLTGEIEKLNSNPSMIKDLLEKKQGEYDEHSVKLDDAVNTKNILTFIENVIGEENIRRLVVSDLIKLLNNQIQTYLVSMGADFTCMFDKDLNYTFLTKNGETEYSAFSSGEKMRMSIATSFAFRDFIVNRSGINSNVLILDEYIDANLDDLAVKEIFKILREFNILYNQNIYVVSHREAVKLNTFDGVFSVDKTDGISKINKQSGE
jgi:DNA repair exonuclease SbcCD ATPase subunit